MASRPCSRICGTFLPHTLGDFGFSFWQLENLSRVDWVSEFLCAKGFALTPTAIR